MNRDRDNSPSIRSQKTRRTSGEHPVGRGQANLREVLKTLGENLLCHRDVDGARFHPERRNQRNSVITLRMRDEDALRHHPGPDAGHVAENIGQRRKLRIPRIPHDRESLIAPRDIPQREPRLADKLPDSAVEIRHRIAYGDFQQSRAQLIDDWMRREIVATVHQHQRRLIAEEINEGIFVIGSGRLPIFLPML